MPIVNNGGTKGGRNNYRGILADVAALNALAGTRDGDYATNNTTGTIWFFDNDAWSDSGSNTAGDMQSAVYDPTGIAGSPYNTDNHFNGTNTRVFTNAQETKLNGLSNHSRGTVADNAGKNALTNQAEGDYVFQTDSDSIWTLIGGTWVESGGAAPLSRIVTSDSVDDDLVIKDGETIIVGAQGAAGHIELTINATCSSFRIMDPNDFLIAAYHIRVRIAPGDSILLRNAGDNIFTSKDAADLWSYINLRTGLGGNI